MFLVSLIPAFKDNYIWLLTRGQRAAVVDPGDAAPVLERLRADGLTLESILVTHHHADHQGGVAELVERHAAQVSHRPASLSQAAPVPCRAASASTCSARRSRSWRCPGIRWAISPIARRACCSAATRCSAPAAAACSRERRRRCRIAGGDRRAARRHGDPLRHEYTEMNLRFALAVEPDNPALHERVARVAALRAAGLPSVPSTLADEKASNPFLRCAEPAVVEAALAHGAVDRSPTAVFAALRVWRNVF
jgi:hydroxyacylglutathione hydrolase